MRNRHVVAALLATVACGLFAACSLEVRGGVVGSGEAGADATLGDAERGDASEGDALDVDADEEAGVIDATVIRDAAFDARIFDASDASADGGCAAGSFFCPSLGQCVSSCLGCGGSAFYGCASVGRCVADCTACKGLPFECFPCEATGLLPASATCLATASPSCYAGGAHCAGCKKLGCPGPQQVCFKLGRGKDECRGCGEPGTNGGGCAGGNKCDEKSSVCSP